MFVKCQILVFWISIVFLVSKNGLAADNNFANHNDPSFASVFDEVINAVNGGEANQGAASLLNNLGSLVNHVDPSMMNGLLGVMANMGKETSTADNTNTNILTSIVDLMRLTGVNFDNIVKYLPVLASTLNSFTGPEASQREQQHKNHEQLLPPFIEYLHVLWDHFTSSSLYRTIVNNYDLKNYLNLVTDQNGDIDYEKFLALLENQKYRKYWMESVADKMASFLRYITDRDSQSQVLESLTYVINNVLTTWNYPSHLRINMDNKVDSISNLINYFLMKNFDTKLDSKSYVKPSLNYLEELIASARNKGYFFTSSYLTQNIIDILNNEIIEPVVKVYRARKFVQERPSCTFYVLCTINQPDKRDRSHLPGVKLMLTKASSIAASWFISRSSEFSFLTLYNVIITDKNCKVKYLEECAEYHYREEQYTNNYVHNEL